MTDDMNKHGAEANADEAAAAYAEAADEQVDAAVSEPDPLELAKAEAADMRDRYLRLAAEMDNLRRRTARDVKDAKSYSVAGFAAICLPSPTTCAARSMPFRRKPANPAMPASTR